MYYGDKEEEMVLWDGNTNPGEEKREEKEYPGWPVRRLLSHSGKTLLITHLVKSVWIGRR
jgi:hypothetical protein